MLCIHEACLRRLEQTPAIVLARVGGALVAALLPPGAIFNRLPASSPDGMV